jgi:hypothetical protein
MFLLTLTNKESDKRISENALPFSVTEPQLFMEHKERFTSGLLLVDL